MPVWLPASCDFPISLQLYIQVKYLHKIFKKIPKGTGDRKEETGCHWEPERNLVCIQSNLIISLGGNEAQTDENLSKDSCAYKDKLRTYLKPHDY